MFSLILQSFKYLLPRDLDRCKTKKPRCGCNGAFLFLEGFGLEGIDDEFVGFVSDGSVERGEVRSLV